MSGFVFARRGARVVVCVLAMGMTEAVAQQAQSGNSTETVAPPQPATTTPAEPAAAPAAAPDSSQPAAQAPDATAQSTAPAKAVKPGAPALPELVVDAAPKDAKKKTAKDKEKEKAYTPAATTVPVEAETPPPGVVLGSPAPSDTGTSTFDANAVNARTTGGGDANTFMRNLPNVQYQNNASTTAGVGSSTVLDTKPALMSISGGRVYENNFILNGVSITNITGAQDYMGTNMPKDHDGVPSATNIYGMSPQNIYVPADFIGKATVIDSNASAEYGQFQGGVVVYDLAGPPTDRYHASVSASRETSDYASYIIATPDGKNPLNIAPPSYDKTKLSASIGAPITKDFSFIAQASRVEAKSSKPTAFPLIAPAADEKSDNIFLHLAVTARTDIGKFTFDTSYTKYFQHWESYLVHNMNLDTNTKGSTNKLEYESILPGVRVDSIGLGKVNLVSRAYYNTNETQNNSDGDLQLGWSKQGLKKVTDPVTGKVTWQQVYLNSSVGNGWCQTVDPATYPLTGAASWNCSEGGLGDQLQGQTDYGADATLSGRLLLGSFKLGGEVKEYEGRRARTDDFSSSVAAFVIGDDGKVYNRARNALAAVQIPGGKFLCSAGDRFCSPKELFYNYSLFPKYDVTADLNAIHTFAEIDQTWKWFNVRAGGRLDYDDYFKNINLAPRVVGTFTPLAGLSFTGGYNRYYLGESLYYRIRDKEPNSVIIGRINPAASYDSSGNVNGWNTSGTPQSYSYGSTAGLDTPYSNEYTGAVGIHDPLLGGFLRLRYLERHNEEQFASVSCGSYCYKVNNDGSSFYRSATAEYTKQWNNLQNPFYLNAAAITGDVTWSEQKTGHSTYLLNADFNGDGGDDTYYRIWYKGQSYRPEQFSAITGNLDIPIRFGVTLDTVWFHDLLELSASAGINLGYQGVYNTTKLQPHLTPDGLTALHFLYDDRNFAPTLNLDLTGRINVTKQASIDFKINNVTNSSQDAIATTSYPWVLGRTMWVGSSLRF